MLQAIGIDFGTSNSEVAQFTFGKPRLIAGPIPSVVGLNSEGDVVFGREAKENFQEDRDVRSIKRLMGTESRVRLGDWDLSVPELATTLLTRIRESAEAKLGGRIRDVVVTVPSNSKGPQRLATRRCAAAAGMHCLTLINEPTAAAIAYGIQSGAEQRLLVFDLGGGTFDVTLLRVFSGIFEEVSSKGIARLGGDDFDRRLMQHVASKVQEQAGLDVLTDSVTRSRLWLHCEQIKLELDSQEEVSSAYPQFFAGSAFGSKLQTLNLDIGPISRRCLETLTDDLIQQTREPIEQVLRDGNIRPRDVNHLLLVGGQSRMPAVRNFVANLLNVSPYRLGEVDPMTCVAEGASAVAAILQQEPGTQDYEYVLTLEHSLCVGVVERQTMEEHLVPILPRRTRIPEEKSDLFHPTADYVPYVQVPVYEGDELDNPDDENNVLLGEIRVPIRPPRPAHECPISVTYRYSEDGILGVRVNDLAEQRTVDAIFQDGLMHAPDSESLRQTAQRLLGLPRPPDGAGFDEEETTPASLPAPIHHPDAEYALGQAEKLLKVMPGDGQLDVERAVQGMRDALSGDGSVEAALEDLQDLITTFAYLLD